MSAVVGGPAGDGGGDAGRARVMLAMDDRLPAQLFDAAARTRLAAAVDLPRGFAAIDLRNVDGTPGRGVLDGSALHAGAFDAGAFDDIDVLVTGWGTPPLDEAILRRLPSLRAVVHSAGSIKGVATEATWERGITFSSAAAVNALPVAEYVLGAILFANKQVFRFRDEYRRRRVGLPLRAEGATVGNYRRVVGLIGASLIGRRVIELLRPFDIDVLLFDPFVDEAEAARLAVHLVSLAELCARSQVVSLHAPAIPSTRHMIDRMMLAAMADGATLINTARGSLVDQAALEAELVTGRLSAVIDTTDPEVLDAASPLYELPNVFLTPHVAGSLGNEVLRLGEATVDEVVQFAATGAFLRSVHQETISRIA